MPDEVRVFGIITLTEYNNFITSIPFFNNWGGKAYCRAEWGTTSAGHVPIKIVSVSPDGTKKYVDRFDLVHFPRSRAIKEAGFRERDCLDNAIRYEFQRDGDHRLYTFYHKDGEHAATFDAWSLKWTN